MATRIQRQSTFSERYSKIALDTIKIIYFKEALGIENLFPQEWANLIDMALKDLNGPIFKLLYKYL